MFHASQPDHRGFVTLAMRPGVAQEDVKDAVLQAVQGDAELQGLVVAEFGARALAAMGLDVSGDSGEARDAAPAPLNLRQELQAAAPGACACS